MPNLLTVGFMPVPPGHRQQITSTISAIELYMEAEIVIVKIEKHPQEMLLFTTNISFLHFLGLMFLIMKSSPLSPSGLNVNNGEDFILNHRHQDLHVLIFVMAVGMEPFHFPHTCTYTYKRK